MEPSAARKEISDEEVDENDEELLGRLISEEAQLIWEEEELIAISESVPKSPSTQIAGDRARRNSLAPV